MSRESLRTTSDEIPKVAERFYTRLYASDVRQEKTTGKTRSTCDVELVTKEKVEKGLRGMKVGKAAGDGGINVDILKESGDIA